MRFRPPLRAGIARHEEKEQKLRHFIQQHVGGRSDRGNELMIVARSLESPVVKAIAALDQQIAAAGRSVRLIVAQVEAETAEAGSSALSCKHEIRWARHPRLIEAHEQLVLGPDACWIGDCMRRDPAKCDAFENYVEDCGEAAGIATVSFERLWSACVPFAAARPECAAASEPGASASH
jgi:hypothetical protein